MGTRCTIKVEGVNFSKVYKHWDGNPGSTLGWLEDFNKCFTDKRGVDSSYKFAQLLRSSSKKADEFDLDPNEFTGWGVEPYDAYVGEEYEYTLKNSGEVTYKKV